MAWCGIALPTLLLELFGRCHHIGKIIQKLHNLLRRHLPAPFEIFRLEILHGAFGLRFDNKRVQISHIWPQPLRPRIACGFRGGVWRQASGASRGLKPAFALPLRPVGRQLGSKSHTLHLQHIQPLQVGGTLEHMQCHVRRFAVLVVFQVRAFYPGIKRAQ